MSHDWSGATVATAIEDRFKPSKVKRAKQRMGSTHAAGVGKWIVAGDEKLSDSYPYYSVARGEDGWLHCSCQEHAGGEFRPVCTHIIAVLLKREEMGEDGEEGAGVAVPPVSSSPTDGEEGVGNMGLLSTDRPLGNSPPPAELVTEGSDATVTSDHPVSERVNGSTPPPLHSTFPLPDDEAWGWPELPEWVEEWRQHQIDAVVDVMEAYERGAKVVFLDAPTGSGKTLIAEAVRRMIGGRAIYTCTTKTLQDQVLEDFHYAAVIKGRRNYPTVMAPYPDVTAEDCTGKGFDDCNWCPDKGVCPYQQAKGVALASELAVLNTAYALTAWNGPGTFRDRELVIIDECDLLEEALMGHVEVRITKRRQEQLGIRPPSIKTHTAKSAKESWREWVEETGVVLARALAKIPEDSDDVREIREGKWLEGMLNKLAVLRRGLEREDEVMGWVYDDPKDGAIVFKPIEVDEFGEGMVWGHGRKFLLMSGTVISAEGMARELGLEGEWDVVKVPSTFPVANRPIHVMTAGKMTKKEEDGVIDNVGRHLRRIVEHHQGERMLIHTVSYKRARKLHEYLEGIPNTRTYSNPRERELLLEWMRRTPGAVVLAPSFDRGVDLPGDMCTVQVVVKMPYPFLGDKQVSARMRTGRRGQQWFTIQTVRTLVQMTGRGVRSDEDTCVTYILDGQFKVVWQKNRGLIPEWWKEAVDWTGKARSTLGL